MTFSSIPKREPAWATAPAPADCDFRHPVSGPEAAWLTGVLLAGFGAEGVQVTGRLRRGEGRTGHFRVKDASGSWVAHVKPQSVEGDLDLAADIADWLDAGEIPVAHYRRMEDGGAEHSADDLFVTVTRYHSARHCAYTIDDAEAVGTGLAKLHVRLAECPSSEAVRRRASDFARDLARTQVSVAEKGAPDIPEQWRGAVEKAARNHVPEAAFEGEAQCGHGDLSPGNIIFGANGQAVFCDFEDSAFCYRPRSFDLAMATLRFALEGGRGGDGCSPQARAGALLGAYEQQYGSVPSPAALKRAIVGLSQHFLLVLTALARQGLVLEDNEWRKAAGWADLAEIKP